MSTGSCAITTGPEAKDSRKGGGIVGWTFRCEYVRCCKSGCRTCPHGPYWYGWFRVGKRVHKRYFGKLDPRRGTHGHPWDVIFCQQAATEALARQILGANSSEPLDAVWRRYLALLRANPPGAPGCQERAAWALAAWTWLRTRTGGS